MPSPEYVAVIAYVPAVGKLVVMVPTLLAMVTDWIAVPLE